MLRLLPALLLALALAAPPAAQTCTISWASATDGSWHDSARWSPSRVPNAADTACITANGTYTVSATSATVSAQNLVLGGSNGVQTMLLSRALTIGQTGTIRSNGVLDWTADYLESGALTNEGLIRLTGTSASRGVRGGTTSLTNSGTVTFEDAGRFYVYNGATVTNEALWDIADAGDLYGSSNTGTFTNTGTWRKRGDGLSQVVGGGLVVQNTGTLDVRAGEIRFERPSTHTGAAFAVASGATLQFLSFGVRFEGTTSGTPLGAVLLDTDVTVADGAIWALGGTGMQWVNDYLESGALTNAGTLRLTGTSASRGVRGGTASLTNSGTVTFEDAGRFYVYNGATVANEALWDIADAGDLYGSSNTGTFTNTGTWRKRGDGLSQVVGGGLVVQNTGTLDVRAGEVRFERPSTHTGATLAVAASATLRFDSFGVRFEGRTIGAPLGTVRIDTDFTTSADAIWDLDGTGIEWVSDYFTEGTLMNTGLVRLTGASASRGVRGDGVRFRNTGTVEHSGTGRFYVYNDARTENAADWQITGEGDLYGSSNVGTFTNEADATIIKTGAGISQVVGGGLVMENEGTLDVRSGEVRFERPSTHTGAAFAVASGATLQFLSFGVRFEGTTSGTPLGAVLLDTDVTVADGAIWALGGTGMQWVNDYLESGALTNAGTLRLTGTSASRGVRGGTASLTNSGTVTFEDAGRFYVYNGATVTNEALWDIADAGDLYGSSNTGTFTNTGTWRKRGDGLSQVVGGGLVVQNTGTLDVRAGEVRFERPSTHTGATLAVAASATLRFDSFGVRFEGRTIGAPLGTVRIDTDFTTSADAIWDLDGTGIEWVSDYLTEGALTNTGLVRLTGTSASRGVRGDNVRFRNEGTIEHVGAGRFYVYNSAIVTNAATWEASEGGDLYGFSGLGTFINAAGATFTASGPDETLFTGGGLVVENAGTVAIPEGILRVQRPFAHLPGAVIQGTGTFAPGSQFVNEGGIAPGASPGLLTWDGRFAPEPSATLDIEIGGTTAGTDYDQLRVMGDAEAGGQLILDLLGSFAPTDGDVLTVLTANAITGGFEFVGLVDPVADISLYPDVTDTAVTLTAFNGIPTVSGDLAITPEEAVNNQIVEFTVTGTGFAPDLSIFLDCDQCFDPEFGPVPGLIRRIRPTEITVLFDLAPEVSGLYDVVVTDPRGGEARGSLTITDAPPTLSLTTLDGQASETGRDPGLFLLSSDRPLRTPLDVPIQLSGSAVHFVDYMTDVIRNTVRFPAGEDSVVVGVYPLNDSEDEFTETVSMRMLYTGQTGQTVASLGITDGPPEDAFEVYVATPDRAANLGVFIATIGGQGFTDATTVQLAGGPLDPLSVDVNEAGTILTVRFDLADQPFGPRDVLVESGAGESRTLPGAITIEAPLYPEVSASVLAPARVPRTRTRTYTVLLHNAGNVDVIGYPSLSGLPVGTDWETDFTAQSASGGPVLPWHQFAPAYESEDVLIITLPRMVLPAGSSREIEVRAAVGQPQTLRLSAAWVYLR